MRILAKSLLLALALAVLPPQARAELVADLSQEEVEVSYRYEGETLLVFGSLPERGGHVLVEVRGPQTTRTVQHKGRVMGFLWMNVEDLTLGGLPGYYALLSDAPPSSFMTAAEQERLGVGREALFRSAERSGSTAKADPRDYFDGLIRSMRDQGLYREEPEGIAVRKGRLFRGELRMPARAPVGEYRVIVRQWKDGGVAYRDERTLRVAKTGVEKWLYDLAHEHPAWYGLLAILIALLTGWLVGMITRGEGEH